MNSPVSVVDILSSPAVDSWLKEQVQPPEALPTFSPSWSHECRDAGGGKGLAYGWHVTIAGGTGVGKTLIALNQTIAAIEAGEHVGVVSLEMSRAQLQTRLLAAKSGEAIVNLERGDTFDLDCAQAVANTVRESRGVAGKCWVNELPISDLDDITRLMGSYLDFGCRLMIVDYIQLVRAPDADSLLSQVTTVSARVREFAARHKVVTIGLSQYNRSTSANRHDVPQVQGLMGGSPLENDSDQVLLLDHSRMERNDRRCRTWLMLAKNRHGATVEIPIEFDYRTLRVREALPDEEHEWPGMM